MKLLKGSKVEVVCRDSEEFSWRLAEIVSVTRSSCLVKYNLSNIGEKTIVEKVSRKEVRLLPPTVVDVDVFDVGDLVEVFDNGSWKSATVLRDSGKKYCKIRLLGSCKELKANTSRIRVRQSWLGNGWVVLKKGFGSLETGTTNCYQNSSCEVLLPSDSRLKNDNIAAQNIGFQESHIVSCRTLKRASPYCSSQMKATCNDSEYPKVDANSYPTQFLGARSSFSSKRIRYDESLKDKPNRPDLQFKYYEQHYDSDTDASVGSCSINGDNRSKFVPAYGCFSDAESCSSPEDEASAEIHRLELDAYRVTLSALYASGSISWEQESLLTNLRLWLHISNDEHLIELRNLISKGIHSR